MFLKQRWVWVLAMTLSVVLGACGRQKNPPLPVVQGDEVRLARSNSEFVYKDHGALVREYRLFGVTGNPFGGNNRDDYVRNFGAPLMTTHLLKANHRSQANAHLREARCEQESAENGFNIVAIAANAQVQEQLDRLSGRQADRLCAKLTGRDLELIDWRLDGQPRGPEVTRKMTRKQSGFDFGAPFLVQSAESMPCE